MSPFELTVFLLASFLAQIAATLVGFGASTLMLPVAVMFVDIKSAIPIVAIYHFMGNLTKMVLFRESLDIQDAITFGVPALIAAVIGALCIPFLPGEWIEKALAVFLIAYSVHAWRSVNAAPQEKLPPEKIALGGAASGFLSGLLGVGGAMRAAVLTAARLEKEKYLATSFAIALAVDMIRIPVYLNAGLLGSQFRGLILPLLIMALVGAYYGRQVVKRLDAASFKKAVLVALFLFGIKLLF